MNMKRTFKTPKSEAVDDLILVYYSLPIAPLCEVIDGANIHILLIPYLQNMKILKSNVYIPINYEGYPLYIVNTHHGKEFY